MRPLGNSEAQSYKVLHLSWKIIWANLTVWCSKMPTPLRNQRPDLRTCLMEMSLVLAPATWNADLFKHPTPATVFQSVTKPSRFAHFFEGAESIRIHCACHKHDGWTSKGSERTLRTFSILIWKRASCHIQKCSEHEESWKSWSVFDNVLRATTACTFNISTSKNRPNPGCS